MSLVNLSDFEVGETVAGSPGTPFIPAINDGPIRHPEQPAKEPFVGVLHEINPEDIVIFDEAGDHYHRIPLIHLTSLEHLVAPDEQHLNNDDEEPAG